MKHYRLDYEKQVHSQHGEDGIIQVMTDAITKPNRFVLEIGWGNGKQNMSRNLLDQGWTGVGIDGGRDPCAEVRIPGGFEFRSLWVDPSNFNEAFRGVPFDLDFFSLDIDSFDFEVAKWALDQGFRPRTVCLEFNYRFGPRAQASFPYVPRSPGTKKFIYNKRLLHGVSLAKYRAFWQSQGYRYFGFDSSCVNVFFYDPNALTALDHYQILGENDLAIQEDLVRPAVQSHDYWSTRLDDIYRPWYHA